MPAPAVMVVAEAERATVSDCSLTGVGVFELDEQPTTPKAIRIPRDILDRIVNVDRIIFLLFVVISVGLPLGTQDIRLSALRAMQHLFISVLLARKQGPCDALIHT
jgi:hypothetical protein